MPTRIGLPLSNWPKADHASWQRATTATDFFYGAGVAVHWRPKSVYQAQTAYGRWLAFALSLWPESEHEPLHERVKIDRIRRYIDVLVGRIRPMSVAAEIGHLVLALSALAPTTDWKWLRCLQYRYQICARPAEKRHKLVHPNRLIELGIALMDSADAQTPSIHTARRFRDGMMVALLASRPLRRLSFAALSLGRHVHRVGTGYRLVLDPADMKTDVGVEIDVPAQLILYFDRYLNSYRGFFPRASRVDALWLSSKGGPLGSDAIYDVVCRRTKTAFGVAINPHLFRTIAATTIAREAPAQLPIARDLLTHASLGTTMLHYAQAQALVAGREYGAALARLRNKTN